MQSIAAAETMLHATVAAAGPGKTNELFRASTQGAVGLEISGARWAATMPPLLVKMCVMFVARFSLNPGSLGEHGRWSLIQKAGPGFKKPRMCSPGLPKPPKLGRGSEHAKPQTLTCSRS